MGYVNKLTDKAEISFICAEFYQARICQLILSHAQQQWCSCHTRVFICNLGCRFSFCTLQTMNWSIKSVISEQPALTWLAVFWFYQWLSETLSLYCWCEKSFILAQSSISFCWTGVLSSVQGQHFLVGQSRYSTWISCTAMWSALNENISKVLCRAQTQ